MTGMGRPALSSDTAWKRSVSFNASPLRARLAAHTSRSASGSAAILTPSRAATSSGGSTTAKCRSVPRQTAARRAMLAASSIPGSPSARSALSIVPIARSAAGTHTTLTSNAKRPPA